MNPSVRLIPVLLFAVAARAASIDSSPASAPASAEPIAIVPLPTSLQAGTGVFTLDAATVLCASNDANPEATQLARMLAPALGKEPKIVTEIRNGTKAIRLNLVADRPGLGNEGYALTVSPEGIVIEAAKRAGLFYGTQTLRQLLPPEAAAPKSAKAWEIPACVISDAPRFPWRGFMLDSSRHFQSVEKVMQVIDLLAQNKLNVLHWHLTEDEAWRIEVEGRPELTEKGAWRAERIGGAGFKKWGGDAAPKETIDSPKSGGFYSAKEVKQIVAYAAARHVTVYPEIEMPGHSTAAIYVHPELGCEGVPFEAGTAEQSGEFGIGSFAFHGRKAFCPSRPETMAFLQEVTLKVSSLFDSPFIHIGADEVPREQWKNCARCQESMKKANIKDEVGLQLDFGSRMTSFLREKGKRPIYWGVDLDRAIPEGIIVQGWHPGESLKAVRHGFQTINSDCNGTYFDFSAGPGDSGQGCPYLGSLPMERVYRFDPVPAEATPEQAKLVLGSEAPLWTELVYEAQVTRKMFPRLFAFSEVLWSRKDQRDYAAFQKRMEPQLKRLSLMNIPYYPGPTTK